MKVGNHSRVLEYDGAFKCYACDQSWGAVTGNPPMPEKCEREERRKKDRRAKEQPGEQKLLMAPKGFEYLSVEWRAYVAALEWQAACLRAERKGLREAAVAAPLPPSPERP